MTIGGGGGVTPQSFGGNVRKAAWNPYPTFISDQTMRFSIHDIRPDPRIKTLTQTSKISRKYLIHDRSYPGMMDSVSP